MQKKNSEEYKQLKHTVTYRKDEIEQELYNWIENRRGVIKASDYIKSKLLEIKNSENK